MRALGLVLAVAGFAGGYNGLRRLQAAVSAPTTITLDARLLLVAADGKEPALAAIRDELDHLGTPYTVVTTSGGPLVASALSDSPGHGLYDGVVCLACGAGTGPDPASSAVLDQYAASFGVRMACLFAQGDPSLGLAAGTRVDTRTSPLMLQYTADGVAVFGWYATSAAVQVSGVAAVLTTATDGTTTPLLVDQAGHAAMAVHRFADGRELMLLAFDQARGAAHSSQLLGGVASWLARGVFIGEKRAYLTPQPDDLFIGTVLSDATTFRMSGDDLRNVAGWQARVQATPVGARFRITFPFVGSEVNDTDDLTRAALDVGSQFFFVSHTFDHHRLDSATYAQMSQELTSNDALMKKYAFGPYDGRSLVTPDISGLANAQVMQGALDWGIQQLVCDATVASCRGSVANTGLPNAAVPGMFMIPRLATNLYANVSTPEQWVASYNALAGTASTGARSIDQILDSESNLLLQHLLAGDINPVMFHQTNLRAYDGTHTLMTDLLDQVLSKYAALRVLPVVSLPLDEIGARMRDRGALDSAGVSATIVPGRSIIVRATQAVRVPVTGAVGGDVEHDGVVTISRVTLASGGQVELPLVDARPDAGAALDGGAPASGGAGIDGGGGRRGGGAAGAAGSSAGATGSDAGPPGNSPARPQGAVALPGATSSGGCACGVAPDGRRRPDRGLWLFALAAITLVLRRTAGSDRAGSDRAGSGRAGSGRAGSGRDRRPARRSTSGPPGGGRAGRLRIR